MRACLCRVALGAGAFLVSSFSSHGQEPVPSALRPAPPALDLATLARQRELARVRAEVERSMDGALPDEVERVAEAIAGESARAGFDPLFVVALIEAESGFVPDAVSETGARGLMQLVPRTFRAFIRIGHILDPVDNVRAGVRYLASIVAHGFRQVGHVLTAYNQGIGGARAVVRGGEEMPEEAVRLQRRVLQIYGRMLEREGRRREDAARLFRRPPDPARTAPATRKVVG